MARSHRNLVSLARVRLVATVLVLGGMVSVASLVAAERAHGANRRQTPASLVAARAAIARLRIPDSIRIDGSCASTRCYKVARPSYEEAADVRGFLHALGARANSNFAGIPSGCTASTSPIFGRWARCTAPGLLDDHVVILFLSLYSPTLHTHKQISSATAEYVARHYSELDIVLECGKGDTTPTDTPSAPCSR
jgi:hypothetical protein